uniref:Uncharacterized protein n=1 Tax=Oryza barthii TaxID=65489 RepID=A0A0D3FFT6_9ORYZ
MPPRRLGEARGRITGPAGGAGLERHRHRWPDGSAKGAGGGGLSSSLPVGTLALPGAPSLLCGEFLGWIEAAAPGEAQAAEAMTPSPRFPFGQNWRGSRRVVEQRGPGPALRGGGSMKSADGGASVRGGGYYVLPFACVDPRRKPSPVVHRATSSGVINSLGRCQGLPSPFLDELLWMGDGGILDVMTTLVASFLEPRLCGVVVGLAAFGHA